MHKRCQPYNSEDIEINVELFSVIRKRNMSTEEKFRVLKTFRKKSQT